MTAAKPFPRSRDQKRAANPDLTAWVSANAGTGKTVVLVDRIARLLLEGVRPERILCLTFTKTGAAEMAERLDRVLGAWTTMADADLRAHLQELMDDKPGAETLARARRLFAQVLDAPGGLKIRTIHSFCESLLGRFPLEAAVAPHFTVIDERTTQELLIEARDRVLGQAFADQDGAAAAALAHLAELTDEQSFEQVLREIVGRRAWLGHLMGQAGGLGALLNAVPGWLGLGEDDVSCDAILAAACDDAALERPALERLAAALAQGATINKAQAAALKNWLARDARERAAVFESEHAEIFLTKAGAPRKASAVSKGAREADGDAEDLFLTEQARVLAVMEKLKARITADATRSLVTIGADMLGAYERLKAQRAYLDYDDLIEKAQALLGSDQRVSWVHFKLDGGLDHILVDESQDTSPAQWKIVQGLAEDFYSGLGASDTVRTVFSVGDEKQSIYSFQGADPAEFGRMKAYFEGRVRDVGQRFEDVPLQTSFRSVPTVLRLVDQVFKDGDAADGLSFLGQAVEHFSDRKDEPGLIELWPIIKHVPPAEPEPWDAPLDQLTASSPEARTAERIADTIAGWIAGGETLSPQGPKIRAGDILILVRRRGVFAEEMVRQLKLKRIAVAGSDRMKLAEQLVVEDLAALGRFALLPDDDLTLATVLKGPLIGLDEEQLFDLAHDRGKRTLWGALVRRKGDNAAFAAAHHALAAHLARADAQPPYEFFAETLSQGGREALLGRLGRDAADPLDEFLGLALDFERTHTPSLQGFLHWVGQGNTEIKRDMETTGDEVRVMTVHGAKGLEAPIVFLPDTTGAPDGRNSDRVQWRRDPVSRDPQALLWSPYKEARAEAYQSLADQAQLERAQEYRRLLYVALTRARDRLYITGWEGKTGRKDGCWYDLVGAAIKTLGQPLGDAENEDTVWRYASGDKVADTSKEQETPKAETAALEAWVSALPKSDPLPPQPLAPSRPDTDAPSPQGPFAGGDENRFKRGLAVHKLLELLPDLPTEERKGAAARWLAEPGLGLGTALQTEIAGETLAILDAPEFAPLFGPGSVAEVALTGLVGTHVVSARIDRLRVTESEVLVVDYKTNRPPPEAARDVAPAYLRQMATYQGLLEKIYPDHTVRCLLLWTDGPRMMELTADVLAGHQL